MLALTLSHFKQGLDSLIGSGLAGLDLRAASWQKKLGKIVKGAGKGCNFYQIKQMEML